MKNIDKIMKNIIKNYPSDKSLNISFTQTPISSDISASLKKEFEQSKFTLSKDMIFSFINDAIHIKIDAGHIILNCVGPIDDIPPILFLFKIIKRAICIIRLFNINKVYTIWLLPIQSKRYFPSNGEIVKPVNINGGYTYINGTTIFIYRFEECAKVLLHEILHHTIYDSAPKWTNIQNANIKKLFHLDDSMICLANEAIIEFWATLFQLIFISYEYHIPFEMLLRKEIEWSKIQSAKILYYQTKYFTNRNIKWKEESNSFCYIIIKSILFINYAEFIKIKAPYSTEILYNFIKYYSNDILNLNHMELKHMNFKNKNKLRLDYIESVENSSMRMTLFGDL